MDNYGQASNPKFKYNKRPQSSKVLVHFKKDDDIKLENPSTMTKREWNKKFNLHKLRTYWTQKTKTSFDITDQKFPSSLLPKEIREYNARKNKPIFQSDYICPDRQKYNHELFNNEHGIGIEKYVTSDNVSSFRKTTTKTFRPITSTNRNWNKNSVFDRSDKKQLSLQIKEEAKKNSETYWKTFNKEKGYTSPENSYKKDLKLMKKIKENTKEERDDILHKVLEENKGEAKSNEKINYLVFKEIKDVYKEKLIEMKNPKPSFIHANKNNFNDKDLSNQIDLLEREGIMNSPENLAPLTIENKKIKAKEEQYNKEIQKDKELLDKENKLIERRKKIYEAYQKEVKYEIPESLYPVNENLIEEKKKDIFFIHRFKTNQPIVSNDKEETFLKAYNSVLQGFMKKSKQNKEKAKSKYNVNYYHPGTYRAFTEGENEHYAWSCCMKESKFSRGCVKKLEKKFKWNFE